MAIQRASILVYSPTGAGKSSLGFSLVRYVKKELGKRTRIILTDFQESETIDLLAALPDADLWDITAWPFPFEALNYAFMGYWPENPLDPKSKMIAPTDATWEEFGGYMFDGITGSANLMMGNMSNRAARGEKIGQDPPTMFADGALKIGGNSMAHYGVAQRQMLDRVEKSKTLGLTAQKKHPMIRYYTAMECKAEDKEQTGKVMVKGPEVAGQALTAAFGRNFGNMFCLHREKNGERRMYLTEWYDSNDPVPYKAKCSLPGAVWDGKTPSYIVIPQPFPTDRHWGLGEYLTLLEQMQEKAKGLYAK